MTFRILHLSETHATASGRDMDGADAVGSLEAVLHECRHLTDLDLVVVSGDIADDGSRAGCAAVRERVAAYAGERGIPHVYCVGNHDDRGAFSAELGSGHLAPDGTDVGVSGPEGSCSAVSDLGGLRIVTLDSLVPGEVHGELGPEQLAWLADVVSEPAPRGTVLVLHHPPIHLSSRPRMGEVGLHDRAALAAVLRGSDVRVVLCGHLHLHLSGALGGVPVWVTPGVVSRIELTDEPGVERAVVGAAAAIIEVGADPSSYPVCHVLHARQPDDGRVLYRYDAVTGEDAQ